MNPSKTVAELEIQSGVLLNAAFVFETALNPVCRCLLRLLNEEERLTVEAICQRLDFEGAVCRNYLSLLCSADLVLKEKENEQVFYAVNFSALDHLQACAEAISP